MHVALHLSDSPVHATVIWRLSALHDPRNSQHLIIHQARLSRSLVAHQINACCLLAEPPIETCM